jgi:hypothetical protein
MSSHCKSSSMTAPFGNYVQCGLQTYSHSSSKLSFSLGPFQTCICGSRPWWMRWSSIVEIFVPHRTPLQWTHGHLIQINPYFFANYCSLRHNLSSLHFCLNRLSISSCFPCSIWEAPCCSCAILHHLYDWLKIEIIQLDSDYATPMVVVRSTMELGMKSLCLWTINNNEC